MEEILVVVDKVEVMADVSDVAKAKVVREKAKQK